MQLFAVTALALNHLLAEKVRALLVRGKPRDLLGVWLLLRQGVEPDLALVEQKLALHDQQWEWGLNARLRWIGLPKPAS